MPEPRVVPVPPTSGALHLRPAGGWTTDTLPPIGRTVVVWAITETAVVGSKVSISLKGQVLVIDDQPDEIWPAVVAWEDATAEAVVITATYPVVGEIIDELRAGAIAGGSDDA